MKFFVPPAGGLFCFRRPQSAPPAKPASRASQQTPSSAFGKSQARRSPSPKVGKAPLSRRTAPPKAAPFCLKKLRRPAKKPQPPQSGKAPVRKQAVAHPTVSKPSASCGRAQAENRAKRRFPECGHSANAERRKSAARHSAGNCGVAKRRKCAGSRAELAESFEPNVRAPRVKTAAQNGCPTARRN